MNFAQMGDLRNAYKTLPEDMKGTLRRPERDGSILLKYI
jgi:hypothetical protein